MRKKSDAPTITLLLLRIMVTNIYQKQPSPGVISSLYTPNHFTAIIHILLKQSFTACMPLLQAT